MKRIPAHLFPAVLLVAMLLAAVALPGAGCSLMGSLRPETTEPIPNDPRVRLVVEVLRPSVVEVRASSDRGALVQEIGLGTGVIVRADGLVVTNDHVITLGGDPGLGDTSSRSPAERIVVRLADGTRADARVVARAPGHDLAFLQIDMTGLPAATLIDDLDEVEVGELAVAIGAAENLEHPVTVGQVTGVLEGLRSRTLPRLETLISSNVPLSQGNSGGPLADERGEVLGINVAVTMGDGDGEDPNGSSLAIPAPVVLQILRQLRR